MTKNKLKTIIMVVALILVVALAAGWIAQTVIRKQEDDDTVAETESCFKVTTENQTGGIMTLSAELYSSTEPVTGTNYYTGEIYTLSATVTSINGDGNIDWEIAFIDPETEYATENDVENYILLITNEMDAHTVQIKCLQPFAEQIVVKASLTDNPDIYATCVCDYEQRYLYNLVLGEYTFRSDGVLAYSNGIKMPVYEAEYIADLSQTGSMNYYLATVSTLYTIPAATPSLSDGEVGFIIEPTQEFSEMFGEMDLMTYSGFGSGSLENFFDSVWAQANNGNYGFVQALAGMTETMPLYRLTMIGTPCGEVGFDLYFDFIYPDDALTLNTNNVIF